ncbi:3-coathanger stack domain-containing protein [Emticicia sp. BO119]|uniref:immunoglobulin domain-containing protein n=1 Tax=Emticicia sp. BO119 TaxID=2757768 RepID=UPI0015F0760A|nr:3-coathanger stack domain-containing protein [Emticicia sp. BO119]MBA4850555.1 hypothetical protein [Emticicia sp. BO119]
MKNFSIKWVRMVVLWLFACSNLIAQNINRVEYFIDNDPGLGSGTEVAITPGVSVLQTFSVPLSSLSISDGIHRLSVRARDENNHWSWTANALFIKERIVNTAPLVNIDKIEYFFNGDPGVGNATNVPVTAATSISNFNFTTPIPSLPIGFHYLSVRVRDARNGWTRCISRPFIKEELPSNNPLPNITQMEYFIDEDPGIGSGTALTFTPATSVSNLSFTIPLPSAVLPGFHSFSVRAKNANNKWSIVTTRTFYKEEIRSSLPVSAIAQVEYFFDNDPGVGNGTAVNFTAGTTVNDLSFNVTLPGALPNGVHKLTVRVKDNQGKWSTAVVRPFYKENTAIASLPNVNKVEYFIDTDPGVGNGTNVSITPNTTLTNLNFTAALTGLSNGKHILEVRARDANNQWSTVAIREFVVCSNPSTASISPAAEQNTCEGTPIALSVPEGYSYQWRLNGENITNANLKTFSATQTGEYTVVIGQNGCLFTTSPVRVNVTATPAPPTILTPNQTICSGQKIALESSGCSGIVTWSNGSTGGAIEVAPTTTTTYTATCSLNGCVSDISSTSCVVTVNAALAAPTVTGPGSAVCPGSAVSLTASGCAGTVTWSTGQTGSALALSTKVTGTYSAICSSGVCKSISSNTFTLNVVNSSANVMSLSASSLKICAGQSSALIATGCTGTILWSTGSSGSSITVSPGSTGTYAATCTQNTCTANSVNTLQIQVSAIPSAPTIYGQSETICKGTSRTMTVYFCKGGTVTWSNGFVGQTQTVAPITTTTYTATCSKDGCPSPNSNAITLTVSECQNQAVNITKIEYFIDNDPGFDNGINVPVTSASVLNNFTISIPIQASFVNGLHYISVRTKDSNSKWSWTVVRPFWKDALPGSIALPNIVKLEYFIDNDPGTDQGTDIPITAGTTIPNLGITIPLDNSLVQGLHYLTIRGKDANGKWSTVALRQFYKEALPASLNLANITRLEYFIDTDPGEGNGTTIPITANSSISNIPLVVNMTGLSQGLHFLELRAQDANGKWSTVGIRQFNNGTNRIAIGTIVAEVCGQNNLTIPFTLEGTFDSGNTLTVQLLDANNNLVNGNMGSVAATANGSISIQMPNVSVNTVYKLKLVSSSPELSSDLVSITVKPSFTPTIIASGDVSFCTGRSVLLSVSGCGGHVVWSNGITNHMISVTASGTFTASCDLSNGCSFPATNTIITTVTPYPTPNTSGNTSVCGANATAALSASGCSSGGNITWYTTASGGSSQFVGESYVTPPLPTTTTFYAACVSADGCESARIPLTVTVKPLPAVNITGTTNLTCATTSVTRTASGGGTYLWSNSLGSNATATMTAAGTYTVTVTGVNGCTTTATTSVTANLTPPTVNITGTTNLTCTTTSVTRTASGGGTYLWSNSLGSNALATMSTAGVYTVTVTNTTNGCTTTATTSVTANLTPPTVNITGTTNLTCTTTSVTRTASGGGTYLWSNSLGSNALATMTTAGVYTVTVTNTTNGCTTTATTSVTSNTTPPTVSITGTTNLTCTTTSVTRTASGGGTYIWSNGLGTNAMATLTAAGTYTVTVTGTNGCTTTATTSVTSNTTQPTVTVTGTTNLTCTTTSVTRTASGGGTYLWSNGLGINATATMTTAGIYTVTVTNTANGCTTTATTSVTSNTTPPVVSITGTNNLNCTTTSVTRTASGGDAYLWSNGLGTNATATMTTAGVYTVTVTNTANGCTTTATTSVTSNTTPPVVSITGTNNLNCINASVTRTASGGGTYLWSNGLGTNATATMTTAGIYTVTVTSTNGCTTTATTNITSSTTPPTATITGTNNLTCSATSVTRTASGGGTYLWSNGLGTNATATMTAAGTYTVTVTGTNGCTATATTSVTSNTTPPMASISGSSHLNCVTNSVTRTASGGGTYVWSNSLGTNAVATMTVAGTYTVTVTGTNGCTATATTTVTSQPTPPTPVITPANPPSICSSQSVTLSATGCTSGIITWSTGATGTSLSVSPSTTTSYTAKCKIDQCFGNNSTAVTVTVTPNCNYPISIQPAEAIFVCPNTAVTLTASGCPGTVTWTGGATGTSATFNPTVTGTYTATCSVGGSGSKVINVSASDVTLTTVDNVMTGTAKFLATQNITSTSRIGQDATNPKPNVLYQAGKSILLQPGFSTVSGSIFLAKIEGCN